MSTLNAVDDADAGYLTDTSTTPHEHTMKSSSPICVPKRDLTEDEIEVKRVTANSQERCRMQKLNYALDCLRRCLPPQLQVCQRRLSKIRTLKLATNYISTLVEILDEHCASEYCSAQRRTLGMDPRFVVKNNIHPDDHDVVFLPEKHEYFKSLESPNSGSLPCQYGISLMSGGTEDGSSFDVTSSSPTFSASPYNREMRKKRNVFPDHNLPKDEFSQVFSHTLFPWYHRGVFITNGPSAVIQQL